MEEALTNTLATAAPVVQAAVPGADIPTWFVVVLGMVIVFIGLICPVSYTHLTLPTTPYV